MLDKPISPLRQRMIEDMTARRFKDKVQKDYVRHVRKFAAFLGPRRFPAAPRRRYRASGLVLDPMAATTLCGNQCPFRRPNHPKPPFGFRPRRVTYGQSRGVGAARRPLYV